MPNTANYSFPTPADTDLVKNGADAIRDLGDAVDTAMNTALGTKKAGMVLLNTTSFSGVASQSINDVFSATYDTYKIIVNLTAASASDTGRFRLRVSGTDNSANNYENGGMYVGAYAASAFGSDNSDLQASFYCGSINSTVAGNIEINIYNPFTTNYTKMTSIGVGSFTTVQNGALTVTTSYTGFTYLAGSGTITGSISVFGVNK